MRNTGVLHKHKILPGSYFDNIAERLIPTPYDRDIGASVWILES
jgi:hypothetical protein